MNCLLLLEGNFDESYWVTLGSSFANVSTVAFDPTKHSTSAAAQSAGIINVSEAINKSNPQPKISGKRPRTRKFEPAKKSNFNPKERSPRRKGQGTEV